MRDKYNLNLLPNNSEEAEYEDVVTAAIPGMGFGDQEYEEEDELTNGPSIPGLNFDENKEQQRKVPYAKPIPKQFQQQWNGDTKRLSPQSMSSLNNNSNQSNEMSAPGPSAPNLGNAINRGFPSTNQNMMGGPMPRFGPPSGPEQHSFGPPPGIPLQGHHSMSSNPNIPPPFMMNSRMPPPSVSSMMAPGSHPLKEHNTRHDNYFIHNSNHRQNPSVDRPLSPRSALNRDTDERFTLSTHFDEDLRQDRNDRQFDDHFERTYDERPFPHRTDVRFNERPDRRDNHFDERRMNRDDQRRDDSIERWRRDDNDMSFRHGFNSDQDFRNRKRGWNNDVPNDRDIKDEANHFQPTDRMWNRISPNGNVNRDRDPIF